MVRDLGARRHQQRLLSATARERARAEVGDERPHAEVERRSGPHEVDHAEAGERLGQAWTRVPASAAGAVAPACGAIARSATRPRLATFDEHLGVLAAEAERRHDRTAADARERALEERAVTPGDHVEQRDQRLDVVDVRRAQRERLARPRERGVRHVEIVHEELAAVLGRDEGLAVAMDVVQTVDETRSVVEVDQRRGSEGLGRVVEDRHRLPRGREVHALAGDLLIEGRVDAVAHVAPAGVLDDVLDEPSREQQTPAVVERASSRDRDVEDLGDRLTDPDPLQHVERGLEDPLDLALRTAAGTRRPCSPGAVAGTNASEDPAERAARPRRTGAPGLAGVPAASERHRSSTDPGAP